MRAISSVLLFALASVVNAQATLAAPGEPEASLGEPAPRFFLPQLDGEDFFLREWSGPDREIIHPWKRHKKVVVLSFFAAWCVPCRAELPEFQALSRQREYEGQDVLWRLVNVSDEPDSIRAFLKRLSVRMPVLLDRYNRVAPRYCGDPVRLPTVAVIDREGVLRHLHHGYDAECMRHVAAAVSALLGIPVPPSWELPQPAPAESTGTPAVREMPPSDGE